MNLKKSELAPTQDLVYIEARFRIDLGRLYLSETQIQALTACARSFSLYRPAHQFPSLLGLMAATLQSVEYAYLHMQPIQWHLKQQWIHTTHGLQHPIFVNNELVHSSFWWSDRHHLSQGMPFKFPNTTITITMDASMEGWDGHCIVPGSGMALFSDLWTADEHQLHINVLRAQGNPPNPPPRPSMMRQTLYSSG